MNEIVSQVQRVSQLIGDISSATAEQSTGIGQVGDAVTPLEQVTPQNTALVEESAAAAERLKPQAATLAEVVGVFKRPRRIRGVVRILSRRLRLSRGKLGMPPLVNPSQTRSCP